MFCNVKLYCIAIVLLVGVSTLNAQLYYDPVNKRLLYDVTQDGRTYRGASEEQQPLHEWERVSRLDPTEAYEEPYDADPRHGEQTRPELMPDGTRVLDDPVFSGELQTGVRTDVWNREPIKKYVIDDDGQVRVWDPNIGQYVRQ